MIKDNVTAREDQDNCRNEEPSGRIKRGTCTKDHTTSTVGALIGKGRIVGHGNRCSESMPWADRLWGGWDLKTTYHCVGGQSHHNKEQPCLRGVRLWLGTFHDVSVGGLLVEGPFWGKGHFLREKHEVEEKTARRKRNSSEGSMRGVHARDT